jgi:4-amino-4-deoxy-L-arabinose transferase-like glycosyltransferase
LIVAAVVLLAGGIRWRLLAVPLERDEGEYAYLGQLMLQGIPPYALAYSMKLPGTGFIYMLGMAVFGQTATGIHLTLLVVSSLTIVFVFLLGRKLAGDLAGAVAASAYGVMSICPAVLGLAAHATHFVVLFAVSATWLMLLAKDRGHWSALFGSGFLFGLAFLMKQQGLCFGLFGAAYLGWEAQRRGGLLTVSFGRRICLFGCGLAMPLVLTCAVLAASGQYGRFWFWTVSYARLYEGTLTLSQGLQENLWPHLQQTKGLSIGFWILALSGLAAAWRVKRLRPAMFFVLAYWAFSFLGTAAGLYFRGHYFILLLPAFALWLGLAVAGWREVMPAKVLPGVFKSLPVFVFGAILCGMLFYNRRVFFEWPADQVGTQIYRQNPFAEAVAAGDLIQKHSPGTARVAVMGSEPEIYFYAHRRSATGYIYMYPLMESQPYAPVMQREMVQEIEAAQPQFIVQVPYEFSWLPQPTSDRYLTDWADVYSRRFYDIIGFAGFDSAGKLATWWGGDPTHAPDFVGPRLVIFQRRENLGGQK